LERGDMSLFGETKGLGKEADSNTIRGKRPSPDIPLRRLNWLRK